MDIELRVLKALESEKEIPFGELVEIIEGAILAAYQKTVGVIPKRDSPVTTRAQLDRKTGQVTIYDRPIAEDGTIADEEIDVTPENFGRIAAYSAKQVITTRLRAIADEPQRATPPVAPYLTCGLGLPSTTSHALMRSPW